MQYIINPEGFQKPSRLDWYAGGVAVNMYNLYMGHTITTHLVVNVKIIKIDEILQNPLAGPNLLISFEDTWLDFIYLYLYFIYFHILYNCLSPC